MKRASIKDVATLAGTSPATVSKVLNNMPASGIPEETAERVRLAAEQLHYVPLSSARQLRRRRTDTVAILLHDLTAFTSEITRGIQEQATARGLTTVLALHDDDSEAEAQQLRMGLRGQVDGLIIAPAHYNRNQTIYDELKDRGVHFVFVDRYIPGYAADYVGLRNEEATYRLTRTLIAQGGTVIGGIFGGHETDAEHGGNTALYERFLGYRRALAEAGLPQDQDLYVRRPGEEPEDVVARLLTRRPAVNAILWASYQYIQNTLAQLAAHGVRVPGDLYFAGFDKVQLAVSTAADYQGLRVICGPWPAAIQPGYEMGVRALELLVQAMGSRAAQAPQHVLLSPHYEWVEGV
ncbi:MAG: LacI family transcriptional regulator [Anaerolineae bacterium]|nr:LacI family transcriptional regulator [Anaerolineae bacterium]